eukprot:m.11373 g.11373  ORF g.11373 m.11373 type:complete len:108 (+) comp3151_c0_seq1:41-364(+)
MRATVVFAALLALCATAAADECPPHMSGGLVYYPTNFKHQFAQSSARIRAPAPKFTAQAIVDGAVKDVSLDDYEGKYLVLFFYPLDCMLRCTLGRCAGSVKRRLLTQ